MRERGKSSQSCEGLRKHNTVVGAKFRRHSEKPKAPLCLLEILRGFGPSHTGIARVLSASNAICRSFLWKSVRMAVGEGASHISGVGGIGRNSGFTHPSCFGQDNHSRARARRALERAGAALAAPRSDKRCNPIAATAHSLEDPAWTSAQCIPPPPEGHEWSCCLQALNDMKQVDTVV